MCLVYIAQDSIRRGLYCSPVPGAICGGKAAVFYGVCVWRRLFFWHSFKFLPGFAVRIKMCSCSWVLEGACGNQQKVVTGKPLYIWPVYAQPKLRGIYQAYTRYILPPPRYISPTTWGRNQKNSLKQRLLALCGVFTLYTMFLVTSGSLVWATLRYWSGWWSSPHIRLR